VLALFVPASVCAAEPAYFEPAPGSAERENLLDAIRPLAEWSFDPPVRFVVKAMRVSGDVAFVDVVAQRPDGTSINPATSPVVLRDGELAELVDGPNLQALLQKSGRMWVAVQHAVGATDAWYSAEELCAIWTPVLPEFCSR
jgi:hypothetical protein